MEGWMTSWAGSLDSILLPVPRADIDIKLCLPPGSIIELNGSIENKRHAPVQRSAKRAGFKHRTGYCRFYSEPPHEEIFVLSRGEAIHQNFAWKASFEWSGVEDVMAGDQR